MEHEKLKIDSGKPKGTRKQDRAVTAVLFAFLLLPGITGVFIAQDFANLEQRLIYFLSSLLLYGFGFVMLRKQLFFYVASVTFLLSAIEIAHQVLNHATTSLLFLFTCIKSEKGEFWELFGYYWFILLTCLVLWAGYYYLNYRFVRNKYAFRRRYRYLLGGVIMLYFAGCVIALSVSPRLLQHDTADAHDARTTALIGMEKVCPVNMVLSSYHIIRLWNTIRRNQRELDSFSFGAQYTGSEDELVVVVVGETSRYDHWQLNGYSRETSPCLMQRTDQWVSFDNCYTIGNLTTVCVPYMFSRATPLDPHRYYREKSLPEAFQEAGYETTWIADQSFNNEFLLRIANACDRQTYISDNSGQDVLVDTVLLEPLRKTLLDGADRQLVVLHTLGCHFKYSSRYPDDYQCFTPDMKGIKIYELLRDISLESDGSIRNSISNRALLNNLRQILVNSYDNAIRYTDYFLEQVVSRIEATGRSAVVVYVGDHGENLLDDERNMLLHGTYAGSLYEYHVPLFVWMSDAYRQRHPDKWDALRDNRRKMISTMNLFYSVLDLGSVTMPDFRTEDCIASPELVPVPKIYALDANLKLSIVSVK